MRALKTIIFLFISNTFMTFAWYGHLKFKEFMGQEPRAFYHHTHQLGNGFF
jgi:hypothetical protein